MSGTRVEVFSPPSVGSGLLCPSLTPPQFSVLAKSFPVPKGRMATGGGGLRRNWSRMESIQPTCSSTKKQLVISGTSRQVEVTQSTSNGRGTETGSP